MEASGGIVLENIRALRRNRRRLHQRGRADPLRQSRRHLHDHRRGASLTMYDLAALEARSPAPSSPAICISRPSQDPRTPMRWPRAQRRSARLGLFCRRAARRPRPRRSRLASAAGQGLYVSVLLRPAISAARLPLLPLAAGLAAAEAIRICERPHGRSALAQRSAARPTQNRRHPRRSRKPMAPLSPSPSSASASTCISAASIPISPRPPRRSILQPAAHRPPGAADRPAKIAGARSRTLARAACGQDDSRARGAGFHMGPRPAG